MIYNKLYKDYLTCTKGFISPDDLVSEVSGSRSFVHKMIKIPMVNTAKGSSGPLKYTRGTDTVLGGMDE
jgi:hypothetical protein